MSKFASGRILAIAAALGAAAAGVLATGCTSSSSRVDTSAAIRYYVKSQGLSDDEALAELNKAIQADPNLTMAHVATGDIYRKRCDWELARRAYEAACMSNPYYFRPHYNLGVVYQSLAEAAGASKLYQEYLQKACQIYLRATVLEPTDYDANLNLSACYFQLGKYEQAQQYCEAAVKADDSRAEAYANLAVIFDSQNKLWEAIKAYKQSLERDSHQPKLHMNLGATYVRQGFLKDAVASFEVAAREDPNSPAPYEQMGSCYYRMNDLPKALEAYRKAAQLDPHSAEAMRGLGIALMTQFVNDKSQPALRDQAVDAWKKSLELKPDQDDLRKLLDKYMPKYDAPQL